MVLDKYMSENGVTQAELAARLGVTQPYVGRLRKLERHPSREVAKKLEAETGIPAERFIFDTKDGVSA